MGLNPVHDILAVGTVTPEIGMGATELSYSDRYPVTIVAVTLFKSGSRKGQVRAVTVQDDHYRVVGGSTHDGSAVYEYTPNPEGHTTVYTADAQGRLKSKGGRPLHVGTRERYYDPHF